jgi:hypothetical protein
MSQKGNQMKTKFDTIRLGEMVCPNCLDSDLAFAVFADHYPNAAIRYRWDVVGIVGENEGDPTPFAWCRSCNEQVTL